ncbi:MAG TPA: sigma-70 family RNA polymerase sigma factor [Firmicutes bacterium]|nr:sigma-70 family RNA polymerase sigma factor [Bacillota bacterium]
MDKTRKLIARSQAGDGKALNRLVEENLPLVFSIVRRFLNRGIEYEDLVQIGSLGLVKAIKDFDLSYDVRFSTYAVPKIMGEIKQQLRKTSPVKVARSLRRLASEIISAKDQLTQKWGRAPTISELAEHLQIAAEEVVTALEAVAPVFYLQEKVAGEEERPEFQELLAVNPDQERFLLKQALQKLAAEDRRLILLRYFAEKSQVEVAKTLGISQAQVSRIEARIVRQLRFEL